LSAVPPPTPWTLSPSRERRGAGLAQRGVRQEDILVYDAIRYFPDRVYQELLYQRRAHR